MVLVDGALTLYVERGGRTLLTWTDEPERLEAATASLAEAARRGSLGRLTVEKADGEQLLGAGATPLRLALQSAGFVSTPRGLQVPCLRATPSTARPACSTVRSTGQQLTVSDFRVPQLATTDLVGATVAGTVSRGKHLLTRIDGGPERGDETWTLHTHLKMEGAWRVHQPGQRWQRPAYQARVVLATATKVAVGFSLGIVELLPRDREDEAVGHLGPDLLGPDWDEDEALRRLREHPDRPVWEALLDQTRLAGIGNMYAAELCFISGVHPLTPVGEVPDLTRMVRRARQVLELNAQRAVQSTTGRPA